MTERLLQPDRLTQLLDDSSTTTRERQAHLKALRTERTRVERAIQNMSNFIKQGVVSPRDTDFTARLAAQRTRRADVILRKLRSEDAILRQGYARRFIGKVIVAPDTIPISGPIKPLEIAVGEDPDDQTLMVPSSAREWRTTPEQAPRVLGVGIVIGRAAGGLMGPL